jgi:hypothetical protein
MLVPDVIELIARIVLAVILVPAVIELSAVIVLAVTLNPAVIVVPAKIELTAFIVLTFRLIPEMGPLVITEGPASFTPPTASVVFARKLGLSVLNTANTGALGSINPVKRDWSS